MGDLGELVNLREFEGAAQTVLDPVLYDYFAGGAQDEVTVRDNEAAYRRLTLVPRILRGAAPPSLDVTVLGTGMAMPVLLAPTAFHRLAHPEAERATARAAAAAGVTLIAAMLSTVAIEDIAAAARAAEAERDPSLWFQLYIQPDLGFTEAIVARAAAAGCRALVVTVDSAALGRNERNDRNDFHDLPPGVRCENLRELRGGEPGSVRQVVLSPEIAWRHIDWLRGVSDLPIVLKGVLHPADAREAVATGIDGLLVSNHGGRQLDTTPATVGPAPPPGRGGRRPDPGPGGRRHPPRHRRRQGAGPGGRRRRAGPTGPVGPGGGRRGRREPGARPAADRADQRADAVRLRLTPCRDP